MNLGAFVRALRHTLSAGALALLFGVARGHADDRILPAPQAGRERTGATVAACAGGENGARVATDLKTAAAAPAPCAEQRHDCASTVPEAWRGTWEVTVAYTDHETGALVATDVTTGPVCPGEPIVPRLGDLRLRCWTGATPRSIAFSCRTKRSPRHGCNIFVEARLNSAREGDSWSGAGGWKAKVVGECEHSRSGEDVFVSGTRVSREARCDGARSSLVDRFFATTWLDALLGPADGGTQ